MKKQLIAVGLAGLLTIPTVSFGAEMAGPSLYGSFRTGLTFGSGDATVGDFTSRWGFQGSHEVAEGLTASYKYESRFNTTNAESSGGKGHGHDEVDAMEAIAGMSEIFAHDFATQADSYTPLDAEGEPAVDEMGMPLEAVGHIVYIPGTHDLDEDVDGNVMITEFGVGRFATVTFEDDVTTTGVDESEMPTLYFSIINSQLSGNGHAGTDATEAIDEQPDGGDGGRLSYVSLSGGFGTITLGQIWSASAIHYGFKVDPSYVNGVFGGASYRPGNTVSYSSSAGDVTFQIDKVTGDGARVELGTSANLGPVGVSLGYWSNSNDEAGFTGVAVTSGAAGVNLTIGLGSSTNASGAKSKANVLHIGGSVGDSGLSYAVQVSNTDEVDKAGNDLSQNLIVVTNSLGSGASLIFEHLSPSTGDGVSLLGLKVDF